MKIKFIASAIVFLFAAEAQARVCKNANNGIAQTVDFKVNGLLDAPNNGVGKVTEIVIPSTQGVSANCGFSSIGDAGNMTYRSYVPLVPVVATQGSYQFMQLNEYLMGAVRITDSYAGIFYPPVDHLQMGQHPGVGSGGNFPVVDSNYILRIVVVKPFVGSSAIAPQKIMTVYVTTLPTDPLITPVYYISYSGSIRAPQDCKINAGTELTIDFGKIPANSFVRAGAGNRPENSVEQTRDISIKCVNIDANALMTIRLTSNQVVANDALVSDNPDVGFKVSDTRGNVLIPNNINSNIPFQLNNLVSNIVLKFWPVSITGNSPKPGPFNSRALLLVDFQ